VCQKHVEQEELRTIHLPLMPAKIIIEMVTLTCVCGTNLSGILYEIIKKAH